MKTPNIALRNLETLRTGKDTSTKTPSSLAAGPSAPHLLLAHPRGVTGLHLFFDVGQTPRRGPSWHRGTRPLKTYLLMSDARGEKSRSKGGSVQINDKDFNQDRNQEGLEGSSPALCQLPKSYGKNSVL